MKQSTVFAVFIGFFIFWCLANLTPLQSGNLPFLTSFSPLFYIVLVPIIWVARDRSCLKRLNELSPLILWAILDSLLECLGNVVSFEIRFFSIFIHPILIFGILRVLSPTDKRRDALPIGLIFAGVTFLVAFAFSGFSLLKLDITRFLLIYLPLYRTGTFTYILVLVLKNGLDTNILWKVAFSFSLAFKLLADLTFLENFITISTLAPNSYSFLSLAGNLFYVWGILWLIDFPLSVYNLKGNGITYFKTVEHKVPISLN